MLGMSLICKYLKSILVLVLFCLYGHSALANNVLKRYSVKDGLSQGTVNSIIQDQAGYIWFATENGIDIFDGYSIRKLPGWDGELADHGVYSMRLASNGIVWVVTAGKGLYTYDTNSGDKQQVIQHDPENKEYSIISTLQHVDGQTEWIVTSKTIGLYTRSDRTFRQVVNLSKELVGYDSIYRVRQYDDFLLIATRRGSYGYQISTDTLKKLPFDNNSGLQTISYDRSQAQKHYDIVKTSNKVFIGSNDGVFEFGWQQFSSLFNQGLQDLIIKQVVPKLAIWQLSVDSDQLVITSQSGLYYLDINNYELSFSVRFSDSFKEIGNDSIVSFYKDRNGSYWLGSNGSGAYYWNPKSSLIDNFTYGPSKNNLSHSEVFAVEPDIENKGLLWVGTSNGLNLVNHQSGEVEQFLVTDQSKTTYTHSNIINMQQTPTSLWLVTYDGLKLFDKVSKTLKPFPYTESTNQLLSQELYSFLIYDGFIWLNGESGLSAVDIVTGEVTFIDLASTLIGSNNIWGVHPPLPEHPNKVIYSTVDTLWAYDYKKQEFVELLKLADQSDTDHSSIDNYVIDKNGTLWIAYSGVGLFGYDAESLEKKYEFNSRNSIIDNNVYGLQLDDVGNLWFSTHDGIFMMDIDDNHIRQFNMGDGLAASEFNYGAYTKLANGLFAYGGMSGLSIFDPIILHRATSSQAPAVNFSNIEILNRHLPSKLIYEDKETLELHYDDIGIRINFSTFNANDIDNIQYLYQLSGTRNFTSPLTRENYVAFPQLDSGSYKLQVTAKSESTGELSKPVSLNIRVSYAPWNSPVAHFFYGVLVLGALFFWLRQKQLRQKELVAAHEEVKFRENRLQLALTGSNSDVWDWFADNNEIYAKRVQIELGEDVKSNSISLNQHVELIHPEDRELFQSTWQAFINSQNGDDSFECTYRLKSHSGDWLWYKDLGKVVSRSKNGRASRVTGSYTNITQSRVDEERAKYYGDAFRQTKDWVFIVDESFSRVTANKSLCDSFGWKEEEFDFDPKLIGIERSRARHYRNILPKLKEHGHWSSEELVKTPSGEEYHVIMNISVSRNQNDNSYHYIFVMTDISAQKSAERELRILANYDHLTGLPNRSLLLERIKHAIEHAKREKAQIALFFIDLDRFKHINDSLGHDYGDMLLKEVTARVSDALREDDTVARIGGDEFVVLLERYKSTSNLSRIAQKLINTIEQPIELKHNVVSVGASIGIAMYPDDAITQDKLLRNADVAMYHAKQLGRNNFQFFTEQLNREAKERLAKESALKLAVKNEEFYNLYQPVIDARTGKAVGVEMLMRWNHQGKEISPAEFIPVAEELNLIVTMTDMALDKSLIILRVWRELRPGFYLSINISAPHFAKDSFVEFMNQKLEQYNLPPSSIKLEVTESALINEPDKAIKTMQKLANIGFKLSLDDFGTGYSSLTYLKNLPLEVIKIDRSFINGIGKERADEAIIDATLVLAKSLNMGCVAEGVETQEQLQYLANRECHLIQGFLYYPAITMDRITEKLAKDETEIQVNKEYRA